jgi:Phosphotransferase enzyme family
MTSSPHLRYQKELVALSEDAAIISAIENVVPPGDLWPRSRDWVRLYERFHPGQNPFAILVFATAGAPQLVRHVDVFRSYRPDQGCHPLVVSGELIGWASIMPFPCDSSLPTLASLLAKPGVKTVVQYWPQRRCTVRFQTNGWSRFAKVFPKKYLLRNRGQRLFETALSLHDASVHGLLEFRAAQPLGWDSSTRSLWQEQLEGFPAANRLLGSHGAMMAHRMGCAAASLTRSGVTPSRVFDAAEQLSDSIACGAELGSRVPRLTAAVNALLDTLIKRHAAAKRPLRSIHGDLHPGQWLDDGARLGLLDFDDFSLGDPERDAGFFLAQLESEYKPQIPVQQLGEVFLAGYESISGQLDRLLLAAYASHKWLSKALKAARALRPDGDAMAERCLRRACDILGYTQSGSEREDPFLNNVILAGRS